MSSPDEITLDLLVTRALAGGFNIIRVSDRSDVDVTATLEHRRSRGCRSDECERFTMSREALARFGDRIDRDGRREVVRYSPKTRSQIARMMGEEPSLASEEAGTINVQGMTIVFERARFFQGFQWHLSLGFASFEQLVRWNEMRADALADALTGQLTQPDGSDGIDDLDAYIQDHRDLQTLDVAAWAAERDYAYKPSEPLSQPRRDYRESLRRFREWAVANAYFRADDPRDPDAFYARSDHEFGDVRFFVQTDGDLQERLMVERPHKAPCQSTGTLNDLRTYISNVRLRDQED